MKEVIIFCLRLSAGVLAVGTFIYLSLMPLLGEKKSETESLINMTSYQYEIIQIQKI